MKTQCFFFVRILYWFWNYRGCLHQIYSLQMKNGYFTRLLPSLDVVAISQAPSPESNPNSPLLVATMLVLYTNIKVDVLALNFPQSSKYWEYDLKNSTVIFNFIKLVVMNCIFFSTNLGIYLRFLYPFWIFYKINILQRESRSHVCFFLFSHASHIFIFTSHRCRIYSLTHTCKQIFFSCVATLFSRMWERVSLKWICEWESKTILFVQIQRLRLSELNY